MSRMSGKQLLLFMSLFSALAKSISGNVRCSRPSVTVCLFPGVLGARVYPQWALEWLGWHAVGLPNRLPPTELRFPCSYFKSLIPLRHAGTSAFSAPAAQVRLTQPYRVTITTACCPTSPRCRAYNDHDITRNLTNVMMHIKPAENTKLTDCYYEKKDWRLCKAEASCPVPALTTLKR